MKSDTLSRRPSGKNIVRVGRVFPCVPLVCAAIIGGCQPLPRPFQPENKVVSLKGYLEPGARTGLAAPRIERMFDLHGETPIPPRPLDAVVVYRVDGAPGDGAVALQRGMRRALRTRGIPVVGNITDDTYVVLGAVHIDGGPTPGRETVEIDWTVIRPDGQRVGSVRQRNSVEIGRLDGAWGTIAMAAADGGADGVASLLKEVRIDQDTLDGR